MNPERRALLDALHRQGAVHDAGESDRSLRYRNLDPDSSHLIALQVKLMSAQTVVELGTSNGYSTIWLADAVQETGGRLTTVDLQPQTVAMANVERAGVSGAVEFIQNDAGTYLRSLHDGCVDMLFMDAERTQYVGWWPHPYRVLRAGGLMVIDNAHHPAPDELVGFIDLIAAEPGLDHLTLMVGSGMILARKHTSTVSSGG